MNIDEWEKLVKEISECRKCVISYSRKNPVPGEGNLNAKVMFIGEAPGAREDEMGRPFVGAAGNLLTKLIEEIGLRRSDVFIGNVLKCRPPGNRDPTDEEINNCLPYLIRQIKLIKPKIIVTLGRFSARVIAELANISFKGITRERGIIKEIDLFNNKIIFIPTYHPAAALYRPPLLEDLKKDFYKLKEILEYKTIKKRKGTLDEYF